MNKYFLLTGKLRNFFKRLGPGFITGASDDDPSGVVTYTQTGALFGLKQLWTAPFSFPFMYVVQEMCGRIGLITGKGLAGVIKQNYGVKIVYFAVLILFAANVLNIATDLGAMAASLELLFGFHFFFWLFLITVVTLLIEVFVSYKTYSKYLKYLAFSLLFYVLAAFFVRIDFRSALYSTIFPHLEFSKDYLFNIMAVLGTTISPYLFFWQSYEEVEEEVALGKIKSIGAGIPRVIKSDIHRLKIDTAIGMLFSNIIMWFIILVAGATFFSLGIKDINTAFDAAQVLRPIAGDFAFALFTIGIVSTGLLAAPVLAGSASYALSEAFGMKIGLYRKFKEAHGFYGAITIAMFIGFLINFTGISPIKALYYTAIFNGLVAPPLIFIILHISNNRKIMGENVNGKYSNFLGYTVAILMSVFSLLFIFSLLGLF